MSTNIFLADKQLQKTSNLKEFWEECDAKIPESLRGTTLRKHIATHTSLLNIEEASVDRLTNIMGYHKDIHKSIECRFPLRK